MIKNFRYNMADGDVRTVRLSTNDGLTGYLIKKLELFPVEPGVQKGEHMVNVFTTPRTSALSSSNFDDPTLLASAYLGMNDAAYYGLDLITVFDGMKFNQDITITHKDNATGVAVNVYLELEQVRLDLNEATVATLKDMRGRE
jgi:hypothetical protein